MGKFINDILKTNGKWSFKRVTALFVLFVSIVYAFLKVFIKDFEVLEFVFWGFITYSGTMVGMVLRQKISDPSQYNDKGVNNQYTNDESGNTY